MLSLAASVAVGQRLHTESPIHYEEATPDNCITRLQAKIDSGKTSLKHDDKLGYLPAVLDALDVPASSQALVFSKTSLQITKISPRRPRAIYFGDDVYIGWVQKSDFMEISAVDPKLGAVFYRLDHTESEKPRFFREIGSCLACHATSHTEYVPGHVVFSVFSDSMGSPIAKAGFSSTDHVSPFRTRWGGWYVTGKHGQQRHRGNNTLRYFERAEQFDAERGANQTDLSDLFNVTPYLSKHSDVVALMVMEHQAMVHNRITVASYLGQVLEEKKTQSAAPGESIDRRTEHRLERAVEQLVDSLLLAREAELTAPITGTSGFAKEFVARGRVDAIGRTLRRLDLKERLFHYPCSYLIYSEAFDGLPKLVRKMVYGRLWRVLSADEPSGRFRHLTSENQRSIIEILRATKTELAEEWPSEKGKAPGE
jgi:hypothetical protein